ncbi:hypothetical protein BDZ97DRAFT_1087606 [Flammula alnicola]|nr:hypothetical protein BDZ97DRAFT_1087606 [Flammula alnicola]
MPELPGALSGLKTIKYVSKRLEYALSVRNNPQSFRKIKTNIAKIGKSHWNLSLPASNQKDAKERVKKRLKEEYPDLFEGDSDEARLRLRCALSYTMDCHAQARQRHRRKSMGNYDGKQGHVRNGEDLLQRPGQNGDEPGCRRRMLSNPDLIARIQPRDRTLTTLNQSRIRSSRSRSPISQNLPSQPIQSSSSSAGPSSSSFASTSQLPASSSNQQLHRSSDSIAQSTAHRGERSEIGYQIGRVYDFLNNCFPSMTHFLHRFINFGCNSEELLFAISMWPQARIEDFLRKLPPGPDGRVASDMEIMILVQHFMGDEHLEA